MNKEKALKLASAEIKEKGWLDVASFAKTLGLKTYLTSELKDNESGALVKENDGFSIYINERHPINRQRFTIAHELGHYFLHRDKLKKENQGIVDTIKAVEGMPHITRIKGNGSNKEEKEANRFAARLLMPKSIFKRVYKSTNSIEEVAEKFRVSVQAAAVRANEVFSN